MKVYNFSAGPSTLADWVKQEAQQQFVDYYGCGMSVVEMSHRSAQYTPIHQEAKALLKELMQIPDDYEILFLQGGASTQFAMVPLNLMKSGKADYVLTGHFAEKAWQEAQKYGDAAVAGSSKEANYTYIPDVDKLDLRADADYLHITSNNTIFGSHYTRYPKHDCLVADMSSEILSAPVDVSQFGLIYAGAQKNIAPAGVTIVIIRKDLLGNAKDFCPTMLDYATHAKADSLYNTPPVFCIYMAMLTFRWIKSLGGLEAMAKINREKAALLYDYIDESGFYTNPVAKEYRSIMNVPFVTRSKDLDAQFVKEAGENGLVSIKGHRLVGGMRASIYNAMPIEGVKALIAFMQKFAAEHKND